MTIKRVFSFAEPSAEELDQKINTLLKAVDLEKEISDTTVGQTYRTYQSNMIQVGKKQSFKNTPYYTNVVTVEFESNDPEATSKFADEFVTKINELTSDIDEDEFEDDEETND